MNMNKVSSILKRCIFFEKIAGLVKIPEVSADEINDFIIQLFAKNVINESGDDKLIEYAKRYVKKENTQHPNAGYKEFKIPLQELPYFKNPKYDEIKQSIKKKTGFDLDTLIVTTVVVRPTSRAGGEYNPDTRSIEITLLNVNSIEEFNSTIKWLKEVIVHELTHYIQDCLNRFINVGNKSPEISGLPSKKYREPEDIRIQMNLPHDKQDIEFYPSIKNNFTLIERIVKSREIYKNNKNELCRAAVGLPNNIYENILRELLTNSNLSMDDKKKILKFSKMISTNPLEFFKNLRDDSPEKWKLAIKLLWKEMYTW